MAGTRLAFSKVAVPSCSCVFTEDSKARVRPQEMKPSFPVDVWKPHGGLFPAPLWPLARPPYTFHLLRPHLHSLGFCPKPRSRRLSFTTCHKPLRRCRQASGRCTSFPSEHVKTLFIRTERFLNRDVDWFPCKEWL